jgi:hypothetical protein
MPGISVYALWGYLTTPFLYTYPGFEVQEIEPWGERLDARSILNLTGLRERNILYDEFIGGQPSDR